MMVAPSHEPSAPAMMMLHRLNGIWPVWARCAAGGMTTSLGMGKMVLSMAIIRAMAGAPQVCSKWVYQSARVVIR